MGITVEEIDAILKRTDWEGFYAKLDWLRKKPECAPYENNTLCGFWESWIYSGRRLYHDTEEGLAEFVKDVTMEESRLNAQDIVQVIRSLN